MRIRREAWFTLQPDLDPTRLVFLDETGATTKMSRLRGRAPRGDRCRAALPHGHWKTTTLVAGLRLDGLTAPMVIDGAMNGEVFTAYAETLLAPTLNPGDIVIMDNLPAHKAADARAAIERTGSDTDVPPALGCVSKVVEIGFGASPSGLSFAAVRPRGQGFRRRLADRGFPIHRLCASGFGRKRGAPRGASALFRDTVARSVF